MESNYPEELSSQNMESNYPLAKWTNKRPLELLLFVWGIVKLSVPSELRRFINQYIHKLLLKLSPYVDLYIKEFSSSHSYSSNKIYPYVAAYLGELGRNSAKRYRLNAPTKGKRSFLMKDGEEVTDTYKGVKVWWILVVVRTEYKTREFKLTFHKKDRELISGEYLDHVIKEGKIISEKDRTRKIYVNRGSDTKDARYPWMGAEFNHPVSFDNLAMDPVKKKEIVEDLLKFSRGKDFYARVGKAWKRGYLLYGPPGTGKSTMIAAMANLLKYDVYDVELTAVSNNEQLRKLLISTTNRSVIAIEDIDCSLDITGKRGSNNHTNNNDRINNSNNSSKTNCSNNTSSTKDSDGEKKSNVTLSGLLNFIDGIWSSSEGERIIVFTTNSLEKLDPALIRTGRMDKHIEMSYCCFEGFKVLAKNYLLLEEHPKFDLIRSLFEVTKMTPADVAENLMPKLPDEDSETCLDNLIRALEKARDYQAAKMKACNINKKKAEVVSDCPKANGTEKQEPKRIKEDEESTKAKYTEKPEPKSNKEEEEGSDTTTNDVALIRSGRMDIPTKMSICCFEGFKVLAKNSLLLEEHPKFDLIRSLLEVTEMTPLDVSMNLKPKVPDEDSETCLDNLIRALEKARDDQAVTAKTCELTKGKKAEEDTDNNVA